MVKVTPAHDFNDYLVGQRHGLPMINIFTPEAVTNANVPEQYRDLDRYLARKQVYTTTKDEFTLQDVSDILGNSLSTQFHSATVILLNTAGVRIGESAWTVEFRMHSSGVND